MATMTLQPVLAFADLFAGREDCYGLGAGRVVREPVTVDLYERHLLGVGTGLGVFPLRDDGTLRFAAIDLDAPNFELAAQMSELLPGRTWIERSRSGNAHVWAFFTSPLEAWVPRGIMRAVTAAVGAPEVEVFPKQDRLQAGMVGNYINLPYHGDSRPVLTFDGESMTLEAFVFAAAELANDPDDWRKRATFLGIAPPEQREPATAFGERETLHECAEYIIANAEVNPVREGYRSVVYFNVARQLLNWKQLTPEEAWHVLSQLEAKSPDRVDERELRRIFNNALRGQYTATGCDDPLMAPYVSPTCRIAHGRG